MAYFMLGAFLAAFTSPAPMLLVEPFGHEMPYWLSAVISTVVIFAAWIPIGRLLKSEVTE